MKYLLMSLFSLFSISLQSELFFTPEMIASHLKGYSDEEIDWVKKDLEVVRSICLGGTENGESRFYLATAGGPGARKTTILEKFVAAHPEYQKGVYLDPDPRTLKFMVHSYHAQSLTPLLIASAKSYDEVIKNAYEKWRGGSNYIVLTLLEEALALGRSIIYGTTSTGSHLPRFFTKLKEEGYQIVLLLCSCPDDVRFQAVDYRNQSVRFYQSSAEDAVAKGIYFPQRIQTYFSHADRLYFYWSDRLFDPERLAGIWENGELQVLDPDAMQSFVNKYEMDRAALLAKGESIPSFETLLNRSFPD